MIRTYRMVVATPIHKAKHLLHLLDTTWDKKAKVLPSSGRLKIVGQFNPLAFHVSMAPV
jgi:hypothetical protein